MNIFLRCALFFIVAVFSSFSVAQQSPELPVKSYILTDAQSGQILAEQNANEHLSPASITKLMTGYLTFEALKSGKIKLDTLVNVSRNAYQQEGSRMFIEINSQVPVNELLQGLIVQSGNDAAVALAEYLGGSVAGFTDMMNKKAAELGMKDTHYMNPTGLPDPQHYSSAHDIALLARQIIKDFPQYYHYYGQKSFTYNKIKQSNRNRLLWRNANIDGLKTGHTSDAGYCLTSSEKRGGLRLIGVVLGAAKENERYDASQALFNYGFARFEDVEVLKSNQILTTVPVFKGVQNEIQIEPQHAVHLLLPKEDKDKVTAGLDLPRVIAPVEKGQVLGKITVKVGNKVYTTLPAVAAESVAEAGFFKRGWHSLKLLFAD